DGADRARRGHPLLLVAHPGLLVPHRLPGDPAHPGPIPVRPRDRCLRHRRPARLPRRHHRLGHAADCPGPARRDGIACGGPMSVAPSAIDDLANRAWDALLAADPLQATVIGEHAYDDRLPDISPAGHAARVAQYEALLREADGLAPDPAHSEDALTLSALRSSVEAALAKERADPTTYTVDVMWGMQTDLLTMASYQPLRNPEDGRMLLERWRAIAPTMDQVVANLREGQAAGLLPIRTPAERVAEQLTAEFAAPSEEDGLLAPLQERPEEGWSDGDWHRFADDLQRIVEGSARPALQRFLAYVQSEAVRHAREPELAGIGNLPGGAAIYRALVRGETTSELEPEQIHATGMAEVERI